MKTNTILRSACYLSLIAGLFTALQVNAQTVDRTGMLENPVTVDTVVFADLVFHDVDSNGSYDATWVLSDSVIWVWDDYSTAVAFYTDRMEVRDGDHFTGNNTANDVQVVPGERTYVWMDLDMAGKTYTTWARSEDMADPVLLFQDADFRKFTDTLNRWSALHNPAGEPDSVSVRMVSLVGNAGDFPPPYTDASLSGITLDHGTLVPAFNPDSTEYTAGIPEGISIVSVSATPTASGANVEGGGKYNVSGGSANAEILVKAEDGSSTRTYTIHLLAQGNYAISLPGVSGGSSNIDVSGLALSTLPYTFEMWIRPDGDQPAYAGILYHRGTADAGIQYAAGWQGDGLLRVMTNAGDYGTVSAEPVRDGRWQHVAAVVTDNTRTIYLDGRAVTQTVSSPAYDFSSGNLYIGWDSAIPTRAFKGLVDEVRIWNVARDSASLAEGKYDTLAGDEAGLIAYWNFDDRAANATDLTGNGTDGIINGGTYVSSFVRSDSDGDGVRDFLDNCPETTNPDQADMDGDGTGDLCDGDRDGDGVPNDVDNCPDEPNADQADIDEDGIGDICDPEMPEGLNFAMSLPGGSDGSSSNVDISGLELNSLPYTVEMWMKPYGTQTDNAGLFYHRGTGDAGLQYSSLWQVSGRLRFMTNSGDYGTLTDPVSTDVWHHVSVILTGSSRTIILDGKTYTSSGTFAAYDFSAGNLYLGWDSAVPGRAFKGLIDEVKVWNLARTAQEINDGKFDTLSGDEPGLVAYWNFDDRADSATDLTASAHHGKINGGSYAISDVFDNMEYAGSDAAQKDAFVNTNSRDNVVMSLEIETLKRNNALRLIALNLSATGTTALADIENVRVYSTGPDSVFSTGNPIAQSGGTPASERFVLQCDQPLSTGENHFWITLDVSMDATSGNTLDLVCDSLTLAGVDTSSWVPSTPSPEGSLVIDPDRFINHARLPVDVVATDAATSIGGANFVSFQQNAIMTYRGYQYVTYWNRAVHVCIARRKLPAGAWEILELTDYTVSLSHVADNHYSISMGICANDGTIHLAFDHHGDNLPLNYRISVDSLANKPDEIPWTEASFGATRDYLVSGTQIRDVTYPRFLSKPDGDLIFECRIGTSGYGDSFLWEYSAGTGLWEYVGEYLNGTSVNENGYINGIHYDPSGRMHVSWVWRQTPDANTNHDVYYGYSDDDGRTWYNAEGTQVAVVNDSPMTLSTAGLKVWTVGTNRALINQESQAVDSKGGIHILQSFLPDDAPNTSDFWGARQNYAVLRHIYRDQSGVWQNDLIARSTANRSEIAVDRYDNVYVVAPDYRVYAATAANGWQNWIEFDITQAGSSINEGLIDREALLQDNVLSFVFAHSDNDGKVIVPAYLLENQEPGTGEGLNVTVFDDTQWGHPVSQKLDVVDLKTGDISVTSDSASIRCKGVLETVLAEAYTLHLTTSGSARIWINDSLLIETGDVSVTAEFQTELELQPSHKYRIRIEGVYDASLVVLKLEWSSPSQERELVPLTSLYGELEDLHISVEPLRQTARSSISCYPNPSGTSFTLLAAGSFRYGVYTISGKLVEGGKGYDCCELGGELEKGVYLLKVFLDHRVENTMLIKY